MRFGLLTALSLFLLLPVAASAQSLSGLGDSPDSPFTISVDPQYPAPLGTASVSVTSTIIDLANATLSISVGGKILYQGSVQPTSLTVGKAGSTTKVVVAISSGGKDYTQTVSIRPQDVVLIAEPISSTPPLYPGKPLIPNEGTVRVVAVANFRTAGGGAIDPTTLSYAWKVDGTQIFNSSGIGKNAVIVAAPLLYRARTISVAITNQSETLVGGDSFTFSPQEPSVRIYENDPLLGIRFDRAVTDAYTIGNTEATLYAAPFSIGTTKGTPLLQWFLNGAAAQTGNSITLRPTGEGQGRASLSLTASPAGGGNTTASGNLSLIFGAATSNNLFGL